MTVTKTLRPAQITDWPSIRRIYLEGIATGLATFETSCGVPEGGSDWFSGKIENSVFVLGEDQVAGWSALSPVSDRCVYGGVAEVSVYVDPAAGGKGLGTVLLNRLIEFAEQNNYWTLQAGIFQENVPSVRLHEKCGFRTVGVREKLGQLNGEWKDVLLMERRSTTIQ